MTENKENAPRNSLPPPSGENLNKRAFRKVLFRALLFPLVSAFLLALLISWQIKALLDMTTWVDRSQQLISQSHRVQKLLTDMETGLRGYALTGDREYLNPYEEARTELDSALAKIHRLVEEQPREIARVKKVEALAKEWVVRYSDVTITRLKGGRRRVYDPAIGRTMMDEMRDELSQLIQVATVLREERVERAQTMARVLSGGGVLFALSLGFFLALSARRHIFHLTELYQAALDERNRLLASETLRSQQAQEAVRARDEFLSIASHELKTPLTSLRLQLQLMEKAIKNSAGPEKIASHSGQSLKSIDRITHLVDDMLDISRISAGRLTLHKERFDLAQLVKEVADRLSPLAQQAGCTIELENKEPAAGEWDRFRLDQVLTNLISNAIKYGAGGAIQVTLRAKADSVVLEVRDQGIGIAPENHERIFQRFERVNSEHSVSGMGLGLYITRQIVDMQGGTLEVKSRLGHGALFRVTLPRSKA